MTIDLDVVILGGGPCGLAAAITLAKCGRRIGVFERNRVAGPRVGETLGPEIAATLQNLGVFDEFVNLDKIPFRGVSSAWGGEELVNRPSIVHPLGDGYHVDRATFDALLARHAIDAGVILHENVGLAAIETFHEEWRLSWNDDLHATCRFILDASGRGAPAGARAFPERRWVACDRAIGIVTRLSPPPGREFDPELLIETAEIGWWYVALQPGPTLLCVLLTDTDLMAVGRRDELLTRWKSAFDATRHVRALCDDAKIVDGPRIVRADTGFLWPNHGRAWRAIGDAAFASDPLSGDGIARGMSDALVAAIDVDAWLAGGSEAPRNPAEIDKRIPGYLDVRRRYYRMEGRWPHALFWKRRHSIDWPSIPITLDPRVLLVATPHEPDLHKLAPIEGLIPPRLIRSTLQYCDKPRPAHEILGYLRSHAPVGDRRLLIALQELVTEEFLRVDASSLSGQP